MGTDFAAGRQWNWKSFWICSLVSCGQLAFGYPSSIISTTLGQPSFLLYMKLINEKGEPTHNSSELIGATSGVFQAGAFFGAMIGSWVMDKYGRRVGLIYCATLSIIGGACLAAAQNIGMFITFRFFAGAGSWVFLALSVLILLLPLVSCLTETQPNTCLYFGTSTPQITWFLCRNEWCWNYRRLRPRCLHGLSLFFCER